MKLLVAKSFPRRWEYAPARPAPNRPQSCSRSRTFCPRSRWRRKKSSTFTSPSTCQLFSLSCRMGVSSLSVSSQISPTSSSRISSMVTSPSVPPCSSVTTAMCCFCPAELRQQFADALAAVNKKHVRLSAAGSMGFPAASRASRSFAYSTPTTLSMVLHTPGCANNRPPHTAG